MNTQEKIEQCILMGDYAFRAGYLQTALKNMIDAYPRARTSEQRVAREIAVDALEQIAKAKGQS